MIGILEIFGGVAVLTLLFTLWEVSRDAKQGVAQKRTRRYITPINKRDLLRTFIQKNSWKEFRGTFDLRDIFLVVFDTDGSRYVGFVTEYNLQALKTAGFFQWGHKVPVRLLKEDERKKLIGRGSLASLPEDVHEDIDRAINLLYITRWFSLYLKYEKEASQRMKKPRDLLAEYREPGGVLDFLPEHTMLLPREEDPH